MKKILLILLYSLLGLNAWSLQAVSYHFRHIGIADGLPDNYVKNVFGLPDGRIGVRTTGLLSLYDSKNFVDFPLWKTPLYEIDHRSVIPVAYVDAERLLWLKEKGGLRAFSLNTERFLNVDSLLAEWNLKGKMTNLFVDANGTRYVTDSASRLYKYDAQNKKWHQLATLGNRPAGKVITMECLHNLCWIVYEDGTLRCYDKQKGKFVREENFLKGRLQSNDLVSVKLAGDSDLWIVWNRGAGYYVSSSGTWREWKGFTSDCGEIVSTDTDGAGNVWVGTSSKALFLVDRFSLSATNVEPLKYLSAENGYSNIHSIYVDKKSGTLWAGLYNQGLVCYHPNMDNFVLHDASNVKGVWKNQNIGCLVEQDSRYILMGTQKGLYRYDKAEDKMDIPYSELSSQLFRISYKDSKGRIWLGTYLDGLYCIHDGHISHYLAEPQDGIEQNNIRALTEDHEGNLWVSVKGGVGRFSPKDGTIRFLSDKFPKLKAYKIANVLIVDQNDRLVVGADNGIYIYDIRHEKLSVPEFDTPNHPLQTLGSNKYNAGYCDSRNLLWLGTQYGVKILLPDGSVDYLDRSYGLGNLTVQSILEDNNHDIWLSTINALYRITVMRANGKYSYRVDCMDHNLSLQKWNDLYSFCSLKTQTGELFFGLMDGFYCFSPEGLVSVPCSRAPIFTSFRLFNDVVKCGQKYDGRVLFQEAVDNVRHVVLNYDENFIGFDFSSLNFISPAQTYFKYILEGIDREWIEIYPEQGQGSAVYNHLPPGTYRFRVMASGNDHKWSEESVFVVEVRPPFWATAWAMALYVLIVIGMIYWGIYYMIRRNNRKLNLLKAQETARQQEELNQMKFRFFTNISHELRTPLTLIMTPIEVLRKKVTDEKMARQLDTVYKNAQELYRLVNQLLDFRKVEMRMEKLHLSAGDLAEFTTSIHACFLPFSDEKHLHFDLQIEPGKWYTQFDHDKLHKIVNNLLSNAFKFTPEGGSVMLRLAMKDMEDKRYAVFIVSDTGIGMSEDELPHIFNRFYQVQDASSDRTVGSGIGLHLVKEYVGLLKGRIEVTSHVGEGTTFTVYIPFRADEEVLADKPEMASEADESMSETQSSDKRKKLLIVEDNHDFRAFLKEQLEEMYLVCEAPDGEAGEKLAIEQNPDLIISDIMMPKVDGIELCRRIKNNVQTSHIPVILLTARAGDEDKISGYEVGADSYISKPFNFGVLLVRIKKLIEQQESRQTEFQHNLEVNPSEITITPLDQQLLEKALDLLEKNMENAEYGVEALSKDMAMSRMSLYRKLQAVTGQTPVEFIRNIRLKRAAQLLKSDNKLSVIEVAYKVGFNSSGYFARCFKEQFGVLPSQYVSEE